MKSTVKIDYAACADKLIPLIKIIRPADIMDISEQQDVDIRDKMVNDFLHHPNHVNRNEFFQLGLYGVMDDTKPEVATIEPIVEVDLLEKFRYALIKRFIFPNDLKEIETILPDEEREKLNKFEPIPGQRVYEEINKFFDMASKWKRADKNWIY